jgi:hypothetical protein
VDGEEMEEWIIICGGNGVNWMEETYWRGRKMEQ